MTKVLSLLSILILSLPASAGFHMEPYLARTLTGDWEVGNSSGDFTQTNFGIKLGYQAPVGIQVGGDIQTGVGSFTDTGTDFTSVNADFGAYVGYQSFFGLRAYLTYMLSSALIIDGVLLDTTYSDGSGFKLGVGYSFVKMNIPWLAVNLEYHMMSYGESETGGTTTTLTNEFETNAIMLGVSFPFDFGGRKK